MLTKHVGSYFPSGVAKRGRSYFYSGQVDLVSREPDGSVVAEVHGSETYTVTLSVEGSRKAPTIRASCTCPYVSSNFDFCKHIWAALMAVETKEPYASLPRSVKLELGDETEDDGLDDAFDVVPLRASDDPSTLMKVFDNLGIPFPKSFRALLTPEPGKRGSLARPSAPTAIRKATPPAWSRFLNQLATSTYHHDRPSRHVEAPLSELQYILETRDGTSGTKGAVLSLAHRPMTTRGVPGKLKPLSISASDVARLTDPRDREIALMLVGAGATPTYGYGYRNGGRFQNWLVDRNVWGVLLPLLFATDRFCFRVLPEDEPLPLSLDNGEPWELCLGLDPKGARDAYTLSPYFQRGEERKRLKDISLFMDAEPAVFIHQGVMSRVNTHDCVRMIDEFRRHGPVEVRAAERTQFLSALEKVDRLPPVIWPESWKISDVRDVAPQAELHLTMSEGNGAGRRFSGAKVLFKYGETTVDSYQSGAIVLDVSAGRQLRRDREKEAALRRRFMELGGDTDPYTSEPRVLESRLPSMLTKLLDEGWTVFGNKTLFRRGGEISVNVTSGIDWFDLDGYVDFDGQRIPLPELLAAARKGEKFVRLGDGSMGMLPQAWLDQHRRFLELGTMEEGKVRFARTQISLIDALLSELPEATFDAQLAAARKRMQTFQGIASCRPPKEFSGTLRPYQEQGLGWLNFLHEFEWGGCLADDMGLGKTVQVLALLADRKNITESGPALVVVPKSIVFNWVRESAQFAPRLKVLDYTGTERQDVRENLKDYDLVLTTYGTLKRDIEHLKDVSFGYVILDEAQAIKNPTSQNAKAVRLLKTRRRLVMTGTPVENQLGDLWSLFEFLNPGMLGTVNAFRGAFGPRKTTESNGNHLHLLHRTLRPFILRRTKEQVAPELPKRTEQTLECAMPAKQAAYYNELRDYYRGNLLGRVDKHGIAKSKIYVLEALLRLRQAACHPGLVDPTKQDLESAKLEALLPMVEELTAEGHKALIFSQFTSLLSIVRAELDSRKLMYEYLDGQTTDRQQRVDRFQTNGKCPLFLISLKAGGVGLNLTVADYVFILDPWWNPAVEAQAIDRTHRIGQDKNVIAYRLIARDTVEAKIIELQKAKKKLAEEIITEANSLIQSLTREDLSLLLS
jgi:superfamily II DNA or RNA helicase